MMKDRKEEVAKELMNKYREIIIKSASRVAKEEGLELDLKDLGNSFLLMKTLDYALEEERKELIRKFEEIINNKIKYCEEYKSESNEDEKQNDCVLFVLMELKDKLKKL